MMVRERNERFKKEGRTYVIGSVRSAYSFIGAKKVLKSIWQLIVEVLTT